MKFSLLTNFFHKFSQEPPIGWSQLSHHKIRLLVAMSGIAFADILIFMMLGFKTMLFEGSTLVHEHLNADLVLVSNRTKTLFEARGFPKAYLYQASDVEGVATVSPLYYSFGSWVDPWKKEIEPVAVIAFDPVHPVLNLPELNQQLDQIKLANVVLFDRKSQPATGHVVESFSRGETVTTEFSGRRVRVGGIFTLGSTMFIRGHVVTSVGLADRMNYYPEKLSGGQKQRIAIARALVGEPLLVLADEPTAALDSKSGRDVVNIMQKLAKQQGSTILLVTHDSRILDIADRILRMEDGRVTQNVVKVDLTVQEKAREAMAEERLYHQHLQDTMQKRATEELDKSTRNYVDQEARTAMAEQRLYEEHSQETMHTRAAQEVGVDTVEK